MQSGHVRAKTETGFRKINGKLYFFSNVVREVVVQREESKRSTNVQEEKEDSRLVIPAFVPIEQPSPKKYWCF